VRFSHRPETDPTPHAPGFCLTLRHRVRLAAVQCYQPTARLRGRQAGETGFRCYDGTSAPRLGEQVSDRPGSFRIRAI